jgi:hypothetical protein
MRLHLPLLVVATIAAPMTMQAVAQNGVRTRSLVVNGYRGDAEVVQLGGKDYIEVNGLVRIAQGTLSFHGDQIVLTVPMSELSSQHTDNSDPNALSREFMKAGVEEVTLLREWASPLANAIENGFPITEQWVHGFRAKAADGLRMASVAATTAADKSALEFLSREFQLVDGWSNKLLEARESMDTGKYATSPDALKNEPESQKIIGCARSIESLLTSGTFHDDGSCR